MTIRLICIASSVLLATQCTAVREYLACYRAARQILQEECFVSEGPMVDATTSARRHSKRGRDMLEGDFEPVYTYPLTPEQRVEAMRQIRAAGIDHNHPTDVVYVPVAPSETGEAAPGRHYVRYDAKMKAPKDVVVLKD